jgi:exopolyphosphatase/guanosine-5'-triphosphate,3'-diphosphate pyrophosphatase
MASVLASLFGQPRAVSQPSAQRAIIDIGSNTVRLVIFEGPARVPAVFYNEKVNAKLGRGVAEKGLLGAKAMAAALAALGRYAAILRLLGIEDVDTVATAAVRDARNGPHFLAEVARLGLAPRLLSGEEEAEAGAHGVLAAFPDAEGVVGDLGGGSLELTDIGAFGSRHGVSLPLGSLRLPALRAGGGARFGRRVGRMLQAADWAGAHGQTFYLVGGSWRALARYAMLRDKWPIDDSHGYEMSPQAALKLTQLLLRKRRAKTAPAKPRPIKLRTADPALPKRAAGPHVAKSVKAVSLPPLLREEHTIGISASRQASLPDAAALLAVLVRELKPARLVFSGWGLREGLLADRFTAETRREDPLLAGVSAFVDAGGEPLSALGETVADWTARCGLLPAEAAPRREPLRRAAIMLALASMRVEPNLRAEQASDWALRKRWIGLDAEGRAMLAMAVRANNGRTAVPPELLRLASPACLRMAMVWGLATRLARRFTAAGLPALAGSTLLVEDGRLVLAAQPALVALFTETTDKDMRLLAESTGLEPEFRILAEGEALP